MKKGMENRFGVPLFFKSILWSLRWEDVEPEKDKEDIILNAINEGTLEHLRWIIKAYGRKEIKKVLARRLATEFHPESRNLARVVFGLPSFRHAR